MNFSFSFGGLDASEPALCVMTAVFPCCSEEKIRSGVQVVVGTPGRIFDFLERRTLDLSQLKHVVLDEVDRMLDMGFADSVDDILRHRYRRGMRHCVVLKTNPIVVTASDVTVSEEYLCNI